MEGEGRGRVACAGVRGSAVCTHSDVEDGDYVEGRGEDGAHAFDGRLIQAVVGRQHLPVRDKQAQHTLHAA